MCTSFSVACNCSWKLSFTFFLLSSVCAFTRITDTHTPLILNVLFTFLSFTHFHSSGMCLSSLKETQPLHILLSSLGFTRIYIFLRKYIFLPTVLAPLQISFILLTPSTSSLYFTVSSTNSSFYTSEDFTFHAMNLTHSVSRALHQSLILTPTSLLIIFVPVLTSFLSSVLLCMWVMSALCIIAMNPAVLSHFVCCRGNTRDTA